MQPSEIRVVDKGKMIRVSWPDGTTHNLSAAHLRRHSRSAGAERARIDDDVVHTGPDLAIVGVEPIGRYAINISFSDGHDRGIYPWDYLQTLAESAMSPAAAIT